MCEAYASSFESHTDAAGERPPLSQRGSCRVRPSEAARLQERMGGRVHEIIPKDLADCEKVEPWKTAPINWKRRVIHANSLCYT